MKFEARKKVGNVLSGVGSFALGTLGGTAAVAVTNAYADHCGLGLGARIGLLCLNGIGAWCVVRPLVNKMVDSIDDWVCTPTKEELLAQRVVQLEAEVAQTTKKGAK